MESAMNEIIDRKMAIAMGLKRYFTGKPCCRGHVAERVVSSKSCMECGGKAHYAKNKAKRLEKNKIWRDNNKDRVKIYLSNRREIIREQSRRYRCKLSVMRETFKSLNITLPEISNATR